METQERRRGDRCRVDLGLGLFHDGRALRGETKIIDLGHGGFALLCPAPLELGQSVGFKVRLKPDLEIEGSAQVRWRESAGPEGGFVHGTSFSNLSYLHRLHLKRYLEPGRMDVLAMFDLGLLSAATLVGLFAFRKLWTENLSINENMWVFIPAGVAAALLYWTFSARIRSRS